MKKRIFLLFLFLTTIIILIKFNRDLSNKFLFDTKKIVSSVTQKEIYIKSIFETGRDYYTSVFYFELKKPSNLNNFNFINKNKKDFSKDFDYFLKRLKSDTSEKEYTNIKTKLENIIYLDDTQYLYREEYFHRTNIFTNYKDKSLSLKKEIYVYNKNLNKGYLISIIFYEVKPKKQNLYAYKFQ